MNTTKKKYKIGYLTSLRECLLKELAGCEVFDHDLGRNLGYRKSMIQRLSEHYSTLVQEMPLADVFLFFDDDICEVDDSVAADRLKFGNFGFYRVSSKEYRQAKKSGNVNDNFLKIKLQYEEKLLSLVLSLEIDVLVCDSYMLILTEHFLKNYNGMILNIHPGITDKLDQGWLPGATPTRDAVTRARNGYIIVDDKDLVEHPAGRNIEVVYGGKRRSAREVGRLGRSGVTCHYVNNIVDGGAVISEFVYNFDLENVSEEQIRSWNYQIKLDVFIAALKILFFSIMMKETRFNLSPNGAVSSEKREPKELGPELSP